MKTSSDGSASMSFSFQATPETLELLCGMKPGAISMPRHAVTLDRVEKLPGNPPYPAPRKGWARIFDLLTGRRSHELRIWAVKFRAWRDAGCPSIESVVRVYIPNAVVRRADDATIEIGVELE